MRLKYAHLVKECRVLGSGKATDSLNTTVNAPNSAVREHLLISGVVVVAVEDDLWYMRVDEIGGDFLQRIAALKPIGNSLKSLGGDSVQDRVD